MLLQQILDAYSIAKEKLISCFRDRPNINLILKAITNQFQDVFDNIWKLQNNRYISTATGIHLDNIGEIVGQTRAYSYESYEGIFTFYGNRTGSGFNEGVFADLTIGNIINQTRDDQTYRLAIRAKVIANCGSATPEDIISIAKLITVNGDIRYEEVYPCGVSIYILEDIESGLLQYASTIVQKYLPAGVRLINFMKGTS